jgi:hypothetical protein
MGEPFEDVKKTVDEELKRLAKKEQDNVKDVPKLVEEEDDLSKNKNPSNDDKKRLGDIGKTLENILKLCQTDAKNSCNQGARRSERDSPLAEGHGKMVS